MAQIFPKWMNYAHYGLAAGMAGMGAFAVFFLWYWGSPRYTDVGYRPRQPVAFSHKQHAGDLGMDCRYCHTEIERGAHANIPATQTCMNCHTLVKPDSTKLALVRQSWESGQPIEWVNVHLLPQYAYFSHASHLRAGVGCASCHGRIDEMEVVAQAEPLSMGWCLECHRNPGPHLRPDGVRPTDMEWQPGPDHDQLATRLIAERNIQPPEDCSACHR